MKKTLFFYLLFLHHVSSGQILNSSFENWTFDPTAVTPAQQWRLNDWMHCDLVGNPAQLLFGTYRDTSPQSGLFALTLSRWYYYTYDVAKYKNSCNTRPFSLNGFYKYSESMMATGITDTAQISVYLTRFDSSSQTTDTIGSGQLDLTASADYISFQCPVTYHQLNFVPDSITILIQPSKFMSGVGGCATESWCSYLTVDNISLAVSTGTVQPLHPSPYLIFPNPASSTISITGEISNKRLTIYNALGKLVYSKVALTNNEILDTASLKSGIYLLWIDSKATRLIIEKG